MTDKQPTLPSQHPPYGFTDSSTTVIPFIGSSLKVLPTIVGGRAMVTLVLGNEKLTTHPSDLQKAIDNAERWCANFKSGWKNGGADA